jgi:hypothetical protein
MTVTGTDSIDTTLGDRLAILDLINRYSDAVTRQDWSQVQAVWTDDALWEVAAPMDIRVETAAGIRAAIEAGISSYEFLVQTAHNSVVTLEGNGRASASSTMQEIGRSKDRQTSIMMLGIYRDQLVRSEAGWQFSHRRFEPIYIDSAPLPGQAIGS